MKTASVLLDALKEYYDTNSKEILEDYKTFLSFSSIGADPTQEEQVLACADWVEGFLKESGFQVDVWETSEHPVIFGQDLSAGPDKPTLLLYNHYDVQPVDPLDLWDNPPFEPTVKDGAIYARGAQDNKGQCFYVLQALKTVKRHLGRFPLNIKIIVEGDEETGSTGLAGILSQHANQLKADYFFVVDVGIPDAQTPSVTIGVRGVGALEVTCRGSDTDLHSGSHGGLAYNPIHALVEILSKLRDPSGKITVPGFYDGIEPLSPKQREALSFDFDAVKYEKESGGAKPTGGEQGIHPLERNWLRPTLEINGITGGFSGVGVKTVIPAVASAKISCRVAADQDPEKVIQAVASYLKLLEPPGITVTTHLFSGYGKAVITDPHSKAAQAAAQAFTEVFGKPCRFILEGASIPISASLQQVCGGQLVLIGLGLAGDRIHAPNEHFGLDRLQQGYLIIARIIEILGTTGEA